MSVVRPHNLSKYRTTFSCSNNIYSISGFALRPAQTPAHISSVPLTSTANDQSIIHFRVSFDSALTALETAVFAVRPEGSQGTSTLRMRSFQPVPSGESGETTRRTRWENLDLTRFSSRRSVSCGVDQPSRPTSTHGSGGHTNHSHTSSRRLHRTSLYALHHVHYLASARCRQKQPFVTHKDSKGGPAWHAP